MMLKLLMVRDGRNGQSRKQLVSNLLEDAGKLVIVVNEQLCSDLFRPAEYMQKTVKLCRA
jgi:hypothetical protein